MTTSSSFVSSGFVPWPADVVKRYREAGVWNGSTLFDILRHGATNHGERIAVVDGRERLSYAELFERAQVLARRLVRLGIRKGDAIVLQLPNCIAAIEACFGAFRAGALPVMAHPAHRRLEITQFAKKSRAVAHVVAEHGSFEHRQLSDAVRAECPGLRHTLIVGDPGTQAALDSSWAGDATLPELPTDDDVALFQLSGGSTNVPKLIARTHADYAYSIRQSARVCRFDESTVYLAVLPVLHNFPLSSPGVLGTLFGGGKVVLADSPSPEHAFDWIAREGVTVTALVPALVPVWLSAARRLRSSLSTLSLVQVGGAKLDESLARRIEPELGGRLQQVFGMAEGLVCYTSLDDSIENVASNQGKPMSPLDELRIVDDADRDVVPGSVGHLLARGPYTIRGYFDAVDHDKTAFTSDGYYRTGDLVRKLAEGSLVVEGRAKDQINRGGEKIAAPEVEAQLCAHPEVLAAAVVAMPDRYLGERSCAFLVASAKIEPQAFALHLQARGLAAYKVPDRFELVESLPKTAVGKIDKRALRERARSLVTSPKPRRAHASPQAASEKPR